MNEETKPNVIDYDDFDEWVDYSHQRLRGVNFSGWPMAGYTFACSILTYANLEDTDLSRSSLYRTDLRFANILHTNLTETEIEGMIIDDGEGREYVIGRGDEE